jgi:ribosomal protein S18 acetylase RimI-like enzyme
MAATAYASETESVRTLRLDPGGWRDYRTLRLMALRTDPQAFEASLETQRAMPDTWWQERLREAQPENGGWLLFARQGDRLIGMAGAVLSDDGATACITGVFVVPDARGQGTGEALLRAILDELGQEPSIQRISLYVNASQVAARRLYERAGFLMVARERSTYGDGNEYDEYLMERANEPERWRAARVA